jgi:hypothetical protein
MRSVSGCHAVQASVPVYALIASRLKVAATEVGFVSSNNWDINGAGSAGLFTLWIQRSTAEPQEELGFPARRIVHALTELPALVAPWDGPEAQTRSVPIVALLEWSAEPTIGTLDEGAIAPRTASSRWIRRSEGS